MLARTEDLVEAAKNAAAKQDKDEAYNTYGTKACCVAALGAPKKAEGGKRSGSRGRAVKAICLKRSQRRFLRLTIWRLDCLKLLHQWKSWRS